MVSKNNRQILKQSGAKQTPHYGLRKLSIGVASVLLSTTLYMGATTAYADSNRGIATTTGVSKESLPVDSGGNNQPTTAEKSAVDAKIDGYADVLHSPAPNRPAKKTISGNQSKNAVEVEQTNDKSTLGDISTSPMPTDAWQPTPSIQVSKDHVATIDTADQPLMVQGDGWQMSLDKNYIKIGDNATLTIKYFATKPGDVFVLDVGYPSGDLQVNKNVQALPAQVGTTTTVNNNDSLRTQIINVIKQAGTYTQTIKLTGAPNLPVVLQNLQASFGDREYDLILKKGTTVANAQAVGRLYMVGNFTPTMKEDGSRIEVQSPKGEVVPVLSTNNNYLFTVAPGWADRGAVLDPTYNGDFTYSIAVPSTFELDQAATEALYQRGGDYRTINVTASQDGVGAPVIIKATALTELNYYHTIIYNSNQGVSFLGHFIDAPSTATLLKASGRTEITDIVGGHTQTITLKGLEATVINAANYDRNQVWVGGDVVTDYGDMNRDFYQNHEVPVTDPGNPINLIDVMYTTNASPFDVKNATVTMTFDDGLRINPASFSDHRYGSAFNLEDSPVEITYQDGTHETISKATRWNQTKNIKSATWTMTSWNSGRGAGIARHGLGLQGFVADHYQDGRPVQIGDQIKVTLDVRGINTAGYEYTGSISDTLKVVNQHLAPINGIKYFGGVDHFGLGDDPSGTTNFHWERTDSGMKGLIKWQNPTFYYVMPQTVSHIKNVRFVIPGGAVNPDYIPSLESVNYVKSKDGIHTVAIIKFKGTYDFSNQTVHWLYFDNVNRDNVVNQTSTGYFYWTADNVNSDSMTQAIDNEQRGYGIKPSSDVKESLLPANLTTDELNKIYFAFSSDATIDMATGMYSYGNAKALNEPWQSKATIDYHGDGQAALGVSIVNNTGNELKNVLAIVNVPKVSDASHFAVNLTGDLTELIDPSTNKVLNDGVTVLYSTQTANLATSDLSAFVPASEIKDWQQVQAVAIKLSNLGGMSSRQVKIPVNVTDLLDKIGKVGVIGTRAQADGLLPMVTTPESERAAKVVVGGQATIEAQMHYRDAQGQDHIIAMPNVTKHYDVTKSTTLAIKDFMPTATDRANIPAGYALSKDAPTVVAGKALLGQTVTAAMDRSVLQFELVPTTQQIVVRFVDDDNSEQEVAKPITYTGTTGQKIDTPIANEIPEHYVLSDMSQVPSQMVVSPHDQTVTVHLKHQRQTGQESQELTRTIEQHTPHDGVKIVKQTVELTRAVGTDQVTGRKTYGNWSTGTWVAYVPTTYPGYEANLKLVPQVNLTGMEADQTVVVTYTADAQTIEVRYVDDDDHEKLVHTNTVSGKSDQTVTITPAAPAGYELVDATPITYQVTVQPNQVVTVHVKHQTSTTTQNKTLTRTIELHTPHDGVKIVKQTVELTRVVGTDQVTGRKTYGNWSTGTWAAYVPTTYPGYEANLKLVPQVNLTGTEADQTVVVTYTADAQTIEVRYVDDDNHEKLVHTNTVSGKSDQTVTITPAAPAGYELVDATPITYQVTAQPNQVVTVHVKHQTSTTTQSKTLTRTIELHTPFDGVKLIKQVAELTRPVTLDQATGQSTTGAWSTGQWDAYQVPIYAGYAPTVDVVPAVNLTGDATDQTVVVNYQALQHTTHVNYVDEDGTLVHTTTLSGKTNEVVTVPNEVPSGWQLVAGQTLPSEVTFTATGYPDTTVTIAHRVITVTADQPQPNGTKLPDNPALTFNGVENADLNRTVTRQIVINLPGQSPQTITQTVHLTRNATVDEVTGQVTYGAWTSGEWTAVTVPTVAGFTPSQSEVPAVAVTATTASQVITINYQAIPAVPTKVTPTKLQAKVAATGKPVVAPRAAAPVQPTSTTERRLPQTGNQAAATGQIWGLLVASLATGLGLWHTKKKEQKG